MMKAILGMLLVWITLPAGAEVSPALKSLQGKWTAERVNSEGRRMKMVLEIKEDKLNFRSTDADGTVRLVAKGTVKAQNAGDFRVLIASDLRAGRNEDNLEPVDDDRANIYILRDGKLYLASGFDKARDNETPRVDEYTKEAGTARSTDKPFGHDKLLGKWKMEATMGEQVMDYGLQFEETAGTLRGTLTSPRSGEYKAKTVSLKGEQFEMHVDREFDGNPVTLVYKGSFKSDSLAGTLQVKGYEDQFTGNWKATR